MRRVNPGPRATRRDVARARPFDAASLAVPVRVLGALIALSSLDVGLDTARDPAREPVEGTLERSSKSEARKRSDAIAAVCELCSIDEISLRLRELGVNARGTKEELVGRLLDCEPAFARRRFLELPGARAPIATEESVLRCLRERDLDAAIDGAVALRVGDASWQAPVTWRESRYRKEMKPLLRRLFTDWPQALDDVPDAARGPYRVAAAMMALRERSCRPEWIDAKGPTRFRLAGRQIARTLLHVARQDLVRERWRAQGITHARVVFAHEPCAACRPLQGKVRNLRGLPSLPLPQCACEGGYSGHLIAYRRSRSV